MGCRIVCHALVSKLFSRKTGKFFSTTTRLQSLDENRFGNFIYSEVVLEENSWDRIRNVKYCPSRVRGTVVMSSIDSFSITEVGRCEKKAFTTARTQQEEKRADGEIVHRDDLRMRNLRLAHVFSLMWNEVEIISIFYNKTGSSQDFLGMQGTL